MTKPESLEERVFGLRGKEDNFDEVALEVFSFQYHNNKVYRRFCDGLGLDPAGVNDPTVIPFLPIELFKRNRVVSFSRKDEAVFISSGTGGDKRSSHYVADLSLYERSFMECFRMFYGEPSAYCIMALLPSYLERQDSSLVYMTKRLIECSGHPLSGFYLDDLRGLAERLSDLDSDGQKFILLGVSFALLDLAASFPRSLGEGIIMETGGMKGRRREMVREELHSVLCNAFGREHIHSEYGMTELLSQAYSQGLGRFRCPPWMRVYIRDSNDPLDIMGSDAAGGINVIDLANIYSCSFIATQDLGRLHPGGVFEVLGRFDNSDVRGCNLLVDLTV